jgi:hypothetical protein
MSIIGLGGIGAVKKRDSYNKYGGLIYIFEPITDKIASEIMKKVPYLNK